MDLNPLAHDADAAIEARQTEAWRRMTPAEKLGLVMQMNAVVRELAMAGGRQRYPDAARREQFLRLAQVTLGDELPRAAYPELNDLDQR